VAAESNLLGFGIVHLEKEQNVRILVKRTQCLKEMASKYQNLASNDGQLTDSSESGFSVSRKMLHVVLLSAMSIIVLVASASRSMNVGRWVSLVLYPKGHGLICSLGYFCRGGDVK
jgi:Flp pilus assembly protein TadB